MLVISRKEKESLKAFPGAILLPNQRVNKEFVKVSANKEIFKVLNGREKNEVNYFINFNALPTAKRKIEGLYPAVKIKLLMKKSAFENTSYDEVMRQVRYKLSGCEYGGKTAYSMLHYFSIDVKEYNKSNIVIVLYANERCRNMLDIIFGKASDLPTAGTCLKDAEYA